MNDNGFMLFANQRKLVSRMSDVQKGQLLDALFAANDGEDVTLDDPLVDTVFMVIHESMERVKAFNAKQKANGSKGGRPVTQNNPDKTQNNPNVTQPEPNKSLENENKNKNILTPPISYGDVPPPGGSVRQVKAKKFVPPSVEEVRAYCDERHNGIDADLFIDHYAARGWKTKGGDKMQDWKACVRTWEKYEDERKHSASTVPRPTTVAQQRQQERQIMARMLLDAGERERAQEVRDAHGNKVVTNPDGSQLTLPPGW